MITIITLSTFRPFANPLPNVREWSAGSAHGFKWWDPKLCFLRPLELSPLGVMKCAHNLGALTPTGREGGGLWWVKKGSSSRSPIRCGNEIIICPHEGEQTEWSTKDKRKVSCCLASSLIISDILSIGNHERCRLHSSFTQFLIRNFRSLQLVSTHVGVVYRWMHEINMQHQ